MVGSRHVGKWRTEPAKAAISYMEINSLRLLSLSLRLSLLIVFRIFQLLLWKFFQLIVDPVISLLEPTEAQLQL